MELPNSARLKVEKQNKQIKTEKQITENRKREKHFSG
jgi:hypothetical protein